MGREPVARRELEVPRKNGKTFLKWDAGAHHREATRVALVAGAPTVKRADKVHV
jgi:hypothetical protein